MPTYIHTCKCSHEHSYKIYDFWNSVTTFDLGNVYLNNILVRRPFTRADHVIYFHYVPFTPGLPILTLYMLTFNVNSVYRRTGECTAFSLYLHNVSVCLYMFIFLPLSMLYGHFGPRSLLKFYSFSLVLGIVEIKAYAQKI